MKATKWTAEEIALLREKYPVCSKDELRALFPDRTTVAVEGSAKRLGIKKGVPRFHFTPEQTEALRRDYADTDSRTLAERFGCDVYALYRKALVLGLKKSPLFISEQKKQIALSKPGFLKNTFKKGNIPFNKGKKIEEIYSPEAMEKIRKTQFKKGHKPWQAKYDGAITVRRDNRGGKYKVIRISESKWEFLHRRIWMQHYGAVPAGGNIVFKDGNPLNCVIENLECISNKELLERNRISGYPLELQAAIKTRNKIIKKIQDHGKKQN